MASKFQIIDPILSTVVQGYRPQRFVGERLFPRIPVPTSSGQIIEFGADAFALYKATRAPGTVTKRVEFGFSGKTYGLENCALEGKVPVEVARDAEKVPGIKLGERAVKGVMGNLLLGLEFQIAQAALTAGNYDADHKVDLSAAKWTNDANSPSADIEEGKEAIRASVGIYPNVCILSAKAFAAAKNNAKVVERFKYTSKDSITTQMLAELWGLKEVHVGEAVYNAGAGITDIWGVHAVLAYVAPEEERSMESPSFGYTYTLEGHPAVEQPYYERPAKSWIYGVSHERSPVLTGMTSGYLLQNVA